MSFEYWLVEVSELVSAEITPMELFEAYERTILDLFNKGTTPSEAADFLRYFA